MLVLGPADEKRPHRPGKLPARRRLVPAIRHLVGRAAEEPAGEAAVGARGVEEVEVDDPRQRDDPAETETRPRGCPQRQLAARRMAEQRDAVEVEWTRARELVDVVDGAKDIVESAGPAAAGIAEAPVLDVPRRDPVRGEIEAQMAGVGEVVDCLPVPTVHHDGDRMRAGARGKPQVAELERIGPVRDACVGVGRRRVVEDVRARPRHASSPRNAG
jgi:hypothetical protein